MYVYSDLPVYYMHSLWQILRNLWLDLPNFQLISFHAICRGQAVPATTMSFTMTTSSPQMTFRPSPTSSAIPTFAATAVSPIPPPRTMPIRLQTKPAPCCRDGWKGEWDAVSRLTFMCIYGCDSLYIPSIYCKHNLHMHHTHTHARAHTHTHTHTHTLAAVTGPALLQALPRGMLAFP